RRRPRPSCAGSAALPSRVGRQLAPTSLTAASSPGSSKRCGGRGLAMGHAIDGGGSEVPMLSAQEGVRLEPPVELHSGKYYINAIRDELPRDVFRRVPSRLLWLPVHVVIIAAGWWAMIALKPHWSLMLLASLIIGHSYACLSFVG